ncbi:sensor histidine kinase [Methylosinus sp. LW4]|uniref:sensor histidine kinase n=1 Tax=Methylosinus sp. LW4 TaxID=136993 RepID=UPI000382C3A6|nr:HAMP domain-containing sensor histidine kinase [Methylosinus sp. LW4]
MIRHPSLSLRLIGYLIAAQIIAFIGTALLIMPLYAIFNLGDGEITLDDWAAERVYRLLFDSVERIDGDLVLRPTSELVDYAANNPGFLFAAFDVVTGRPVPGSSEDIVSTLRRHDDIRLDWAQFGIKTSGRDLRHCISRKQKPPAGAVATIACNYAFHWHDIYYVVRDWLRMYLSFPNLLVDMPGVALSVLIAWIVVRHELAPIRRAASAAARIDLGSLAQRIPEDGTPAEILPLVTSVNGALARLDAGVARQRRFAANAAHELRTPISILRARVDNPSELDFREDLRRNLRRMRTIVEQLLVLAKSNENAHAEMEVIDVVHLALAMVADYMPLVIENGRRIEFDRPTGPVFVRGDRRALESVIANLIDNALRMEPRGGTILVAVRPGALIEVADHGHGVEARDREVIFEPFWRKTETAEGTGLGLAIVKELLDAHLGEITVAETPGGGATFKIFLEQISVSQNGIFGSGDGDRHGEHASCST